ncbi:MAG TPA: prepilin-type N-terminal cleavage/methylation domain-containing protein [Candidatus Angelobacter sp.]|nr:prepilin-type N-terminal cleavage/methylation domain-containing protein [Candidatus Angelobacter sp.]
MNHKVAILRRQRGFTIIEMVIVVAIVLIVTATAIPVVYSSIKYYQLQATVASVTGVIRSTRFQAISSGYPYQVVFTKATGKYQLQSDSTQSSPGVFDGTFVNVGNAQTLSGSTTQNPTLGADITLQFSPSGAVKLVTVTGGVTSTSSCSNAGSPCSLALTYGTGTKTVTVTGYGNVTVS